MGRVCNRLLEVVARSRRSLEYSSSVIIPQFQPSQAMSLDTLTPAQRNQSSAAIIGTAFGVGVAVGAIVPLVSLSLERDGYNALMIGINSAMLPIAVILMGPLMPRIIARLGTLRSVYLGLGITALCVLLFPAVPELLRLVRHPLRHRARGRGPLDHQRDLDQPDGDQPQPQPGDGHLRVGDGARLRARAADHQPDGDRGLDPVRGRVGGPGRGAAAGGLCPPGGARRLRPRHRRRRRGPSRRRRR